MPERTFSPAVWEPYWETFVILTGILKSTLRDFVVIMTRGHASDFDVLCQVLKTEAAYIGVIGSRHKIAVTKERLAGEGFDSGDMSRIHLAYRTVDSGKNPGGDCGQHCGPR